MDFNPNIIIKKEELYYEDKTENFLQCDYDIVKVESSMIDDWHIETENLIKSSDDIIVNYNKLSEVHEYKCFVCQKSFPDSFYLFQHNLEHLEVPLIKHRLYFCDYCPNYYRNKSDVEYHIKDHLSRMQKSLKTALPHKCFICNKMMSYKRWYGHMKEVHSTCTFKCDTCLKRFKTKKTLRVHMLYVHQGLKPSWRFRNLNTNSFKCSVCCSILQTKIGLRSHERNCHSKETYPCNFCGSAFKCKSYLLTHVHRVHYDDGSVHSCDICGKTFKSPRYVNIHKKNSHKIFKTKSKSSVV